jgi:hypothetical protein
LLAAGAGIPLLVPSFLWLSRRLGITDVPS